jgi:hypothetical protein
VVRLVLAPLVLAWLVACSSDDDRLSKAEYERRVMEIARGPGERASLLFTAVVVEHPRPLQPGPCAAQVREFHETLEEIVSEVERLRPPAEVGRLQDEFLVAANESVSAVGDVADGELECGQPLNRRIYGLASTALADRVIQQFHARGYLRFVRGE